MKEIPDYAALKGIETKDLKHEYAEVRRREMDEWREELDKAGLKKPIPTKAKQREPSIIPPPDSSLEVGTNVNNRNNAMAKTVEVLPLSAVYAPGSPAKKATRLPDSPTIINIPDLIIEDHDTISLSPTVVAESSTCASPSSRKSRPVTADGALNNRDLSPAKSSTAVASRKSISPAKSTTNNKLAWIPSSNNSQLSGSRRASFESASQLSWKSDAKPKRPSLSMDRRLSSAMETVKDTLRNTFYPENWNWMRYDRDEEVLSAFNKFNRYKNKLMSRMNLSPSEEEEHEEERIERLRRQSTDKQKWQRGYHPAINDLHPPVASQLPATREDARWMLLPPPSADVMAGRARPGADDHLRKPLCVTRRAPEGKVGGRDHLDLVSSDKGSSDGTRASSWGSSGVSIVDEEWNVPGWVSMALPSRVYREDTV